MGRRKRLLQRGKCLPEGEDNKACEAADEGADDLWIAGREGSGVDDADEDEDSRKDEEQGTDIVELSEGFLRGETCVWSALLAQFQSEFRCLPRGCFGGW